MIQQIIAAFPQANLLNSRETKTIEYGRSQLVFDREGKLVRYRKEGEGKFTETYPVPDGVDIFDFAMSVLQTGRTVEVGKGVGLRQYDEDIRASSPVHTPWRSLAEREPGYYDFDLNPDYQRGPVWSEHQQRHSWLHGSDLRRCSPSHRDR